MSWHILPFWYAYVLALTLFVGKIAAFAFLMAPVVHSQLEKEQASKLLRVFFPRYYRMGIACAAVALSSLPVLATAAPFRRAYLCGILWTLILLAELYALKVIFPALEAVRAARDRGEPNAAKKWESGHQWSVRLNIANLLMGLLLLGYYAI